MDWRNNGARVEWRTSRSCDNGQCVQVAALEDLAVLIRDSADPGGPVLAVSAGVWRDLTARVKAAPDLDG